MPKFLSTELKLGKALDELGIFDPLLDIDSNYFINIKRLKETKVPEFQNSYDNINKYFDKIGLLLSVSKSNSDRAYREAFKRFNFPELNGICLGFSKGKHGSGFGKNLRRKIIADAKEIIDLGSRDPEIFHLIGLFEDNVGPDRLSDMIARIIYSDICMYTIRVNKELGITKQNYPKIKFYKDGIMENPYKKDKLLLLPKDILHELPIARDWEDIDRVCLENERIRAEINEIIGEKWYKIPTSHKKRLLKEYIFKNPRVLKEVIKDYKKMTVPVYDFDKDIVGEYSIAKIASDLPNKYPIIISNRPQTSIEITKLICNKFKDLVENNKVSELLYVNNKPRSEKIVQRAFFCVAESYCAANNLDISPESDSGRGPVDFKMSRGEDKTVVEIKLTTNNNLIHGFEVQIEEYAKAEKTENKIFMVVDNGGSQSRLDKVKEIYKNKKDSEEKVPDLIVIDAIPKKSASKYKR
ncbi:hypothetical protein L0P54_10490 [Anaerosalibacter bizertensis]|uniref:Uncharacterized protein n=1 Tax=Anaerosalibacter bizertensis TaxID=932217 RepID=A0A9Q4FMK3_9FIRM|nr:hypothetical protein [Anaerosalibacter bizertensis]MBV1820428.1 hypothetical protein [Bacteroidales bacterium MSK.15.36]MCG4566018.1 hypothetical protein [Anaerosalibacter bizertensis]MCG4583416.1 hypothetical protein [Anaerosalibacter bizertensis]